MSQATGGIPLQSQQDSDRYCSDSADGMYSRGSYCAAPITPFGMRLLSLIVPASLKGRTHWMRFIVLKAKEIRIHRLLVITGN
jgi:hypothetical protein